MTFRERVYRALVRCTVDDDMEAFAGAIADEVFQEYASNREMRRVAAALGILEKEGRVERAKRPWRDRHTTYWRIRE